MADKPDTCCIKFLKWTKKTIASLVAKAKHNDDQPLVYQRYHTCPPTGCEHGLCGLLRSEIRANGRAFTFLSHIQVVLMLINGCAVDLLTWAQYGAFVNDQDGNLLILCINFANNFTKKKDGEIKFQPVATTLQTGLCLCAYNFGVWSHCLIERFFPKPLNNNWRWSFRHGGARRMRAFLMFMTFLQAFVVAMACVGLWHFRDETTFYWDLELSKSALVILSALGCAQGSQASMESWALHSKLGNESVASSIASLFSEHVPDRSFSRWVKQHVWRFINLGCIFVFSFAFAFSVIRENMMLHLGIIVAMRIGLVVTFLFNDSNTEQYTPGMQDDQFQANAVYLTFFDTLFKPEQNPAVQAAHDGLGQINVGGQGQGNIPLQDNQALDQGQQYQGQVDAASHHNQALSPAADPGSHNGGQAASGPAPAGQAPANRDQAAPGRHAEQAVQPPSSPGIHVSHHNVQSQQSDQSRHSEQSYPRDDSQDTDRSQIEDDSGLQLVE